MANTESLKTSSEIRTLTAITITEEDGEQVRNVVNVLPRTRTDAVYRQIGTGDERELITLDSSLNNIEYNINNATYSTPKGTATKETRVLSDLTGDKIINPKTTSDAVERYDIEGNSMGTVESTLQSFSTELGRFLHTSDETDLGNFSGDIAGSSTINSVNGQYSGDVVITPASIGAALTSHDHGQITSDGKIASTGDTTIANGDKLLIADSDNDRLVKSTSITFDGSTITKALTPKGTWETFSKLTLGTTATTAAAGNHSHDVISSSANYSTNWKSASGFRWYHVEDNNYASYDVPWKTSEIWVSHYGNRGVALALNWLSGSTYGIKINKLHDDTGSNAWTGWTDLPVPSHTHSYLPLSGGNLTGGVLTTDNIVYRASTASKGYYIQDAAKANYVFMQLNALGTTTSDGIGLLNLGNNIATGTASNSYGWLRIYGTGTGRHDIRPANTTATNYTHWLPMLGGYFGITKTPMYFNWTDGQSALSSAPSWIWGGKDGTNMYVWSPGAILSAGGGLQCKVIQTIGNNSNTLTLSLGVVAKYVSMPRSTSATPVVATNGFIDMSGVKTCDSLATFKSNITNNGTGISNYPGYSGDYIYAAKSTDGKTLWLYDKGSSSGSYIGNSALSDTSISSYHKWMILY